MRLKPFWIKGRFVLIKLKLKVLGVKMGFEEDLGMRRK